MRQRWGIAAPATAMPGMVGELRKAAQPSSGRIPTAVCAAPENGAKTDPLRVARASLAPLLEGVNDANMPQRVTSLVATTRARAPHTTQADIVNGLTRDYCAVLARTEASDVATKVLRVGHFSSPAYAAAASRQPL